MTRIKRPGIWAGRKKEAVCVSNRIPCSLRLGTGIPTDLPPAVSGDMVHSWLGKNLLWESLFWDQQWQEGLLICSGQDNRVIEANTASFLFPSCCCIGQKRNSRGVSIARMPRRASVQGVEPSAQPEG